MFMFCGAKKIIKNIQAYTTNLAQRLKSHHKGNVSSTKYRRPLHLIYFEGCRSEVDAKRREKYLKTKNGKMYL